MAARPESPSRPPATALLEVSAVRKVYGGEVALADAGLSVGAGSIHGLLGANGAGKSTLVRIISGVTPQDGGTVSFDGTTLPIPHSVADAREAGIAYIDQDRALIAEFSIAENVALTVGYPLRRGLLSLREMRRQATAALESVGLAHDVDTVAGELPVSDQTMVAIARAMATDARLILLDEPTSNLASAEAAWLLEKLRRLAESGVACVLITHALGEALDVCDSITVLRDGRTVATRPASELDEGKLTALMLGHDPVPRASAGRPRRDPTHPPRPLLDLQEVAYERLGPLSLSIEPGEMMAVTGLADSGHLLVGDALTGVRPLDGGSMRLDGAQFAPRGVADAMRHGVVCVPPDRLADGLALDLTSRENLFLDGVAFSRRLRGIYASSERSGARELLADGHVHPAEPETVVSTLSGGNQQKVLISKWMATLPRVLVLCEPTVGVDVGAREQIYERLHEACAAGLAVLLLSSDFEEVVSLADRVLVLRYGSPVGELSEGEISIGRLDALSGGVARTGIQPAGKRCP